jgi:hypothetical protein
MGIFSGLSGSFLAGASERISANWKEDREKMEAKIAKKTQLFYDDAKIARDARRAEKKAVKGQYEDALLVLGDDPNAGAVAEALARLSPERYKETMATLTKVRAEAAVKNTGTSLSELGYASAGTAASGSGELVGVTEKFTGSSEDAVKRIMGTLDNSNVGVNPEEKNSLQKGFLKHIGGISTAGITSEAQREAAEQLGVSPERLRALTSPGDAFTTGIAPQIKGVNLGAIDPSVRMGLQSDALKIRGQDQQFEIGKGTLEGQEQDREVRQLTIDEATKNKEIITIGDQTGTMAEIMAREEILAKQVLRDQATIGSKMKATDRNTLSKAVLGVVDVLEPVGTAFVDTQYGRVYRPSGARAAQGSLAIQIGGILKSNALANVRLRTGDSIDDGRMDGPEDQRFNGANFYLQTQNSMIEILTDIDKDGIDGYVSPYKSAIDAANRKNPGIGTEMLEKITEGAGFGEPLRDGQISEAQWGATSTIDNMEDRVRAVITENFEALGLTNAEENDDFYRLVNLALGDGEVNPTTISKAVRDASAQTRNE